MENIVRVRADSGGWAVRRDGDDERVMTWNEKRDAINFGRNMARTSQSCLVIYNDDDTVNHSEIFALDAEERPLNAQSNGPTN